MDVDDTGTLSSTGQASHGPALAVLAFVHGFKGDDTTFLDFPSRLKHNLTTLFNAGATATPRSSIDGNADSGTSSPRPLTAVHTLVYPAFQTRGELSACVEAFGSWLTTQVAEIEMNYAATIRNGKKELARVVLIGHSMGGIVIADCARSIARGYAQAGEKERMWPRLVGIIAYDTPYLGVHPGVFKNGASEAWSYVQQAQAVATSVGAGWAFLQGKDDGKNKAKAASTNKGKQRATDDDSSLTQSLKGAGKAAQASAAASSWGKYGYAAAGATALAAAAGTAWYSREKLATTASNSQLWVTSHFEFVGELWKEQAMRERLEEVLELADSNVQFHCFYTLLNEKGRTFIVLPSASTLPGAYIQAESKFVSNLNETAKTEIEAHTAIFDLHSNSGVWQLGSQSVQLIASMLASDGRHCR